MNQSVHSRRSPAPAPKDAIERALRNADSRLSFQVFWNPKEQCLDALATLWEEPTRYTDRVVAPGRTVAEAVVEAVRELLHVLSGESGPVSEEAETVAERMSAGIRKATMRRGGQIQRRLDYAHQCKAKEATR